MLTQTSHACADITIMVAAQLDWIPKEVGTKMVTLGASGDAYVPSRGAPLEIRPNVIILQVMMVEVLFLLHFCGARWW